MRRIFFSLAMLLPILLVQAQTGLVLKGSIKTVTPITISVSTLSGQTLFKTDIDKNKSAFELGPVSVVPDLYVLSIGKTKQNIFLTNSTVTIKGYYDDINNQNSSLDFDGLDEHFKLMEFAPKTSWDFNLNTNAFTALNFKELTALAYLFHSGKYDFNNNFLLKIPVNERQTESAKWLVRAVDSLKQYTAGIPAPDFSLPDENNKAVSLKDFRNKIMVLDFWASWCGPCRREMEKFKTFYKDFEPGVQFISISMDNDQSKYQQGLKEMNIPWVKLWDKTGFSENPDEKAGFFKSNLRIKYGFKQIPFCVIIGKDGTVLRRDVVNAEDLKKTLIEITKGS
ncbi:TlpA disulfide reductase family protein [Pedobacter sp.]|jgi:thiol-disulfide isomerase/thioredoxin|uniref:TlpA family protein disulfide reductase n=1 Tax=Pedobacter sp. TaxID=1411316 RepID=UPI002CC1F6E6|nr:TlpA disulfide reductase family protein [Pedobacter sp.]HWW39758.1 TlpA disulfide reductase family protein [Pedobacter sp.]